MSETDRYRLTTQNRSIALFAKTKVKFTEVKSSLVIQWTELTHMADLGIFGFRCDIALS